MGLYPAALKPSAVLARLGRRRLCRARPVGLGASSTARADPDAALVCAVLRRLRLGLCGGASRHLVDEGLGAAAGQPLRHWSCTLLLNLARVAQRWGGAVLCHSGRTRL